MSTSLVKLTYEDYLEFPEDGLRHELIDGEHFVTPSPVRKHQRAVNNLSFVLTGYLKLHQSGEVYTAPIDVRLSEVDLVQPDLLVLSTARLIELGDSSIVEGRPDLIVEVLSPGTRRRDQTLKQRLYERFGVPEYWILDPDIDEVHVFRLVDGRYIDAGRFRPGDSFSSPLLPALTIAVSDIF
jgi:Uma2 family endonuclease